MEPASGTSYPVELGASFLGAAQEEFYALRYDFKPASVSDVGRGEMEIQAGTQRVSADRAWHVCGHPRTHDPEGQWAARPVPRRRCTRAPPPDRGAAAPLPGRRRHAGVTGAAEHVWQRSGPVPGVQRAQPRWS